MEFMRTTSGSFALKSFCDHCGNVTIQNIVTTEVPGDGSHTYTLCKCTICDGILLRKHPGNWNAPIGPGQMPLGKDVPFDQLWPASLTLPTEAPERVRQIYQEARVIMRHSPSSFVVQIRRALEAVANDKKAEGRTLLAKTEWLVQNGMLPDVFGEMTHASRMIGNLGAHDGEKDVDPQDVEVADEFFRAIIEYLYVASAKVSKVKALLQKK
jgi:hypothetical protein